MKIDRMLEIIIYLVNHDNVSARYLAERFGVSVRTIQRDIVSISSIGIPVYAAGGKYGGYSILPTYKMKNLNIREDEQQMIRKALESLATSYTSDTLDGLIEKYNAIVEKEGGQKVFWDFSVTRENKKSSGFQSASGKKRFITKTLYRFLIKRRTEHSHSKVWNRWLSIINGMPGICLLIRKKGRHTGLTK